MPVPLMVAVAVVTVFERVTRGSQSTHPIHWSAFSLRPGTNENKRHKWLRVCVSRRSKVALCCALDEGRSLGAALQEEASNRHERLLPNGDGRERHGQKARLDRVRYG
jgi:hypothetical protein